MRSYLANFLSSNPKNKKIRSEKKFLYFLVFRKMELSGSNIKKFLIFSYILRKGPDPSLPPTPPPAPTPHTHTLKKIKNSSYFRKPKP